MKKTLLALGITLFVGLSFVLAGCSSPTTDLNYTETIQSIQGPANVTVSAVTGALKVEWDLVTDAKEYEIRRRENADGSRFIHVETVDKDENEFLDVIADDNILEDAKVYVYQVIAVSGAATRSANGVVQSGVTTASAFTVPPDTFPARGATTVVKPVTAPAASVAPNGHVTITWTSENTAPVTYTFVDYTDSSGSSNATQSEIKEKYASTDVTGEGYFRGAVYAEWPNGYYPASALVELTEVAYAIKTITLDGTGVPTPSATREGALGKVRVTWTPAAGATSYILQKYQVTGNPTLVDELAAWTPVSGAQTRTSTEVVVEDTVPPGSSAYYRLIVQTAKGTTVPGSVSAVLAAITPVTNDATLTATPRTVKNDDGIPPALDATIYDTSVVDIVFEVTDTRPGHTYSIYRRTVGDINGLGTTEGAYELVPGISANFGPAKGVLTTVGTITGTVKLQYNPSAQRQLYDYEVRAYKNGEQVGVSTAIQTAAKDAVTTSGVNTSITPFTPSGGTADDNTQWYGVLLSSFTNAVNNQLIEGETVYIYGRLDPNHPAPTGLDQLQPDEDTISIGTVEYYDGTTEHPYPTFANGGLANGETGPNTVGAGYWVRASAYFSGLTAEVKVAE